MRAVDVTTPSVLLVRDAHLMAEDYRLPGLPRYVRVNTLKIGRGAAEKALRQHSGHFFCPDPKHPANRSYYRDKEVPDLLVFKPKGQSDISRIPMVASGELIVQQKASCFPALALAPPPGATVIDACAAPGNKTSHVAALMGNRGKVFAFEMSERRAALLREMMTVKGATIVTTMHQSFMDADPNDPQYADVTHIMLDPSCSSSGMSQTPEDKPERLRELSDNQVELVLHAMKFPAVVAVVYSTCSIYQIENEKAVRRILRSQSRFRLVKALPWWQRRGQVLDDDGGADDDDAAGTGGDSGGDSGSDDVQEIARCVVRSAYPDDRTIGFFLARFERADATESHTSAQGGTAAGSASDLEFKLNALARARAKEQKEAAQRSKEAEQRKPAGGGSEAEKAGGSSSRPIPQWRLERDANKKKGKRKRE